MNHSVAKPCDPIPRDLGVLVLEVARQPLSRLSERLEPGESASRFPAVQSYPQNDNDNDSLHFHPSQRGQAVQWAIFLLALSVNRFRHAEGEGHGRPHVAATTEAHASLVSLAAALVTQPLLDPNE